MIQLIRVSLCSSHVPGIEKLPAWLQVIHMLFFDTDLLCSYPWWCSQFHLLNSLSFSTRSQGFSLRLSELDFTSLTLFRTDQIFGKCKTRYIQSWFTEVLIACNEYSETHLFLHEKSLLDVMITYLCPYSAWIIMFMHAVNMPLWSSALPSLQR